MQPSFTCKVVLGLLLTLPAVPAQAQSSAIAACGVELRIGTTASTVLSEAGAVYFNRSLVAELVNVTGTAVRLVQPGDGSDVGWRTPLLQWEVVAAAGHPRVLPVARCGNINSLRPGEVFDLAPGQVVRLTEWLPAAFVGPGTYRFRLSYLNDPTLKWQGLELGPHDAAEMARVRASTPCRALSNEISLTVLPARR